MSSSPCYWFELGQEGISYGVGYYGVQKESMDHMREMILDGHPAFINALSCYESQSEFVIGGEMYKRSKFPNQPEKLRLWLDRKNIFFENAQKGFGPAFSKALPEHLINSFLKLKPIYDFFCMVEFR